jgi:tRNA 5-methylaminomethyl-2-thiouridine biosynthesis bifunctional protein
MKTAAIVPATIDFVPGHAPRAPAFGDLYHAEGGALAQARHVFLRGNGLPQRWTGRRRFVIVETGFGLGNNFIATWHAWRGDPGRCGQLVFVSIDKHPPRRADLEQAHAGSPLAQLAAELIESWPPLTPNLHVLDFEGGSVRLLLALGDVGALAGELQLAADAYYLDGFAPARNPVMWDTRVIKALARLAAPGATAATWSAAKALRDALTSAGFEVRRADGFDRKRDMTQAVFAPAFTPRRSPGRAAVHAGGTTASRHALIIGAGLAGASAADALARQGWQCTVFDRHAAPAQAASGNPGGLFHGTAHVSDGVHARFTRAAALLAAQRYAAAIDTAGVPGQCRGLIRMRPTTDVPDLPTSYLQLVAAGELAAQCGLPLSEPTWYYPGGGWIAPAALTAHWLGHARIALRMSSDVVRAERRGVDWHLLDAHGTSLASAPVLVLAQGAAPPIPGTGAPPWPLEVGRGQVSWFATDAAPTRPLSGHGYVLAMPDGRLLCGATTADGDMDPTVREADHAFNLNRLNSLAGLRPVAGAPIEGRTGWRATAPDRLPIVGAVPVAPANIAPGTRLDQARLVPRIPGLFVLGGLASRGLTWAPLAAEVLAAWIDGAPLPLEADLVDAIDPARWLVRAARRSAGGGPLPNRPSDPWRRGTN